MTSSRFAEGAENRGGPTGPAHRQDRRCHSRVATPSTNQPDSTEDGGGCMTRVTRQCFSHYCEKPVVADSPSAAEAAFIVHVFPIWFPQ